MIYYSKLYIWANFKIGNFNCLGHFYFRLAHFPVNLWAVDSRRRLR